MIISEAFFAADRSLSGVVRGYASLFGVVDGAGDMVMPGAFAATLRRRGPERVRMLFQHDHAEPIGTWTDIREDIRGLWVEGRLSIGSRRVRDIAALVADGAIDGLSIGFVPVSACRARRELVRRLVSVDLWEVSLVTFPMLAAARIASNVKPSANVKLMRMK